MIPIVIPAYEPDERLIDLLEALAADPGLGPVLLVDDGSGPRYDALFARANAALALRQGQDVPSRLIRYAPNRGKGAALKWAFSFIRDNWPQAAGCVTADCDGQHTPADIAAVSACLAAHPQALILGVRQLAGPGVPRNSAFGNRLASGLFRLTTGRALDDTQTGLRGIPAAAFQELLAIPANRFDFEMQALIQAAHRGHEIIEQPIATVYDSTDHHSTHYRPLVDSLRIGRIFFGSFVRFSASSLISTMIDLILFWIFCRLFHPFIAGVWYVTWATVAARILSAAQNWLTNYYLVFHSKGSKAHSAGRYFLLALAILAANAGLMTALVALFPAVPPLIFKIIVNLVLFIASYRIQKRFVYKGTSS
jgi:glycosyltransferase involved in cell wall biosynthesis